MDKFVLKKYKRIYINDQLSYFWNKIVIEFWKNTGYFDTI